MITASSPPEAQLMRLLLDDPRLDPDDLDWSVVLPAADAHALTLRLAAWFGRMGITPPPQAHDAIARAQRDAAATVSLLAHVGARLDTLGVRHAFLGVSQHHPDLGRGVGLLVSGPPPDVDTVLFDHVPASALQHAPLLLEQRQQIALDGARCAVPADEDALLLQALERDTGTPPTLSALVWSLGLVHDGCYDGGRLIGAACAMKALPVLRRHFAWLDVMNRHLFGVPLPDARFILRTDGHRPRAPLWRLRHHA